MMERMNKGRMNAEVKKSVQERGPLVQKSTKPSQFKKNAIEEAKRF